MYLSPTPFLLATTSLFFSSVSLFLWGFRVFLLQKKKKCRALERQRHSSESMFPNYLDWLLYWCPWPLHFLFYMGCFHAHIPCCTWSSVLSRAALVTPSRLLSISCSLLSPRPGLSNSPTSRSSRSGHSTWWHNQCWKRENWQRAMEVSQTETTGNSVFWPVWKVHGTSSSSESHLQRWAFTLHNQILCDLPLINTQQRGLEEKHWDWAWPGD